MIDVKKSKYKISKIKVSLLLIFITLFILSANNVIVEYNPFLTYDFLSENKKNDVKEQIIEKVQDFV